MKHLTRRSFWCASLLPLVSLRHAMSDEERPYQFKKFVTKLLKTPPQEIALYQAWSRVVETPGEISERLEPFLKVIEASLGVQAPDFWTDHLRTGVCDETGRSGFGRKVFRRWRKRHGFAVSGATAKIQEDSVVFKTGDLQVAVPTQMLMPKLGYSEDDKVDTAYIGAIAVGWNKDSRSAFLAPYSDGALGPFGLNEILALNSKGDVLWESPIDCGVPVAGTGQWDGGYAEIVVHKETVLVFGISEWFVAIGMYNLSSGRRLVRFCTSHIG